MKEIPTTTKPSAQDIICAALFIGFVTLMLFSGHIARAFQ